MANTVKLKRGSGSDPGASDLVVGEVAIRTDEGKLFTKKDDGTVAEISGGGGISDGDKGDITVSNSGGTFTIDSGVISTAKIADNAVSSVKLAQLAQNRILGRVDAGTGNVQFLTRSEAQTVLNVEDGATADQTASEILSLLSDQNISTTGNLQGDDLTTTGVQLASSSALGRYVRMYGSSGTGQWDIYGNGANLRFTDNQSAGKVVIDTALDVGGDLTVSSAAPKIYLTDTGDNPDYVIKNNNGTIQINDETNGATRFAINTDGHVDVAGNLDVGAGLDVTGTITSTDSLTITNAAPVINLVDDGDNPDYRIVANSGQFKVQDTTNGNADRLLIQVANTRITNNLDAEGGLDVTGDISCSGTVDGRDLATDGTKLDGIATGATNVSNTNQLTNGAGFLTSVATSDIDNNGVTFAKLQDVAQNRIIGRTASGTGACQELTATSVRTLLNVEDGATADQTKSDIDALNVNAATVTVADESSDTSCNVLFAPGASGDKAVKSGSNLTFNSSSGLLVASGFSGDGSALTSLNGSQVTSGTISASRLPSTITPNTIDMEDGDKIKIGASDDLEIFHGTPSDSVYPNFNVIRTVNTNFLLFEVATDSGGILFNHRTGTGILNFENMLTMVPNSGVDLFFNGSRKAKTVTGGFEVTGTCTATAFSGDGSSLTGVTATVANGAIYENAQTITANYTITDGKNAMSAGPISIDDGVTLTVGTGETYVVV